MKKNRGILICLVVFLSIITIFLSLFLFYLVTGKSKLNNFIFSQKISHNLLIDKTYDSNFDEIDITSDMSDIYIKQSNSDKIRVVVYGAHVDIEEFNTELKITSKSKKCIGFCFNRTINKIEVYLPSSYSNLVKIKNAYGDIKIDDLEKIKVDIDEDYGDIEIDRVDSAKIKENAGDINIKKVNDIEMKNSYGDIDIGSIDNYLDIESNAGDIKINSINISKNSTIKSDYGDIEILKINQVYIDAKTSLGDVDITKNYRDWDITLKIENNCGDITVGD